MRILFHRDFSGFTGGHLKVRHYYDHVQATPGFKAWIFFTEQSIWDASNPWFDRVHEVVDIFDAKSADVLFLAGHDWRALPLEDRHTPRRPVINFVQGLRHADHQNLLYDYLEYPAIRITVSNEVKQALEKTGRVNGPVYSIPNGLRTGDLPAVVAWQNRDVDVVICALKNRPLGRQVEARLNAAGISVRLLEHLRLREKYLSEVARAKVGVFLPGLTEGFYLPALEAMALEVLTVCPDCVGNRSFCRDRVTAEMPEFDANVLSVAALKLLSFCEADRNSRLESASDVAAEFTERREREAFQAILRDVPELWDSLRR